MPDGRVRRAADCEDPALRPVGGATEETVYEAITQLGNIFDVPDVARQLNADIRNDFAIAEAALNELAAAAEIMPVACCGVRVGVKG